MPSDSAAPKPMTLDAVLALAYLGITDRPVLPVVIGSSQERIGEFLAAHAADRALANGLHVIAPAGAIARVVDALPTAAQAGEALLSVRIWSGPAEREVRLPRASALTFLRSASALLDEAGAQPSGALNGLTSAVQR